MDAKDLKSKVAIVKRLNKEHTYYVKEAEEQANRIANMRSEGKDFADIRQQAQVLTDTESVLPVTKEKLTAAVGVLESLLNAYMKKETLDQELKDIVEEAAEVLKNIS